MSKAPVGRLAAGTVAFALAVASLVGCSNSGGDDVLSAAEVTGADEGGSVNGQNQRQRAEAFYACLSDAGLPFRIDDYDDTQARVSIADSGYRIALIRNPNGDTWPAVSLDVQLSDAEWEDLYKDPFFGDYFSQTGGGEATLYAEDAAVPALADEGGDATPEPVEDVIKPTGAGPGQTAEAGLVVDGVDHSAEYAACWETSGYTEPEYVADPVEELRQKQAQVDANNAWAACARQNGYPNLKDNEAPVADEWATYPEGIVLPGDMTVEAVQGLLEACPNFDEKRAKEMYEEFQKPNPDYEKYALVVDPSISFDFNWGDENNPISQAESDRFNALSDALYASVNAFYEALYANENGGEGGGIEVRGVG